MSDLGDLIRHYLDTHPGAKKGDIARAAGVSAQSVSGWLNSTTPPNLKDKSILGLAEALGVPVSVVVSAVSKGRGLPVENVAGDDLPADVQVLLATARKLGPEQVRMVTQLAVSLADQVAQQGKRPKAKNGR
jgi:transcriptional regulator with XRE-family HTH domain